MSKSILVIDTPECCIDCSCHFAYYSGMVWCGKENKRLLTDDIQSFKPDWCPIWELPDKKSGNKYHNEYERGVIDGFNVCIDEILKGENGNDKRTV